MTRHDSDPPADAPTFDNLTDATEWYLDNEPWIGESPGRTAAFGVGLLASLLSAWQQYRDLNRTMLDTVTPDDIDADELQRMKTRIWDKSRTYLRQDGDGSGTQDGDESGTQDGNGSGTPWAGIHAIVERALLDGYQTGFDARREELAVWFIHGANRRRALKALVEDDDEEESADTDADAPADTEIEDETAEPLQTNLTELQ